MRHYGDTEAQSRWGLVRDRAEAGPRLCTPIHPAQWAAPRGGPGATLIPATQQSCPVPRRVSSSPTYPSTTPLLSPALLISSAWGDNSLMWKGSARSEFSQLGCHFLKIGLSDG